MTAAHDATPTVLTLAEQLLEVGIPVIVCKPNPRYGESGQPELITPAGWNTITAEQAAADYKARYEEGDTLAMVAGHGIDVLDIDTKVSGVNVSDVPSDAYDLSLGITVTPSKGFHIPVPSTGYSSGSLYFNGKYVGDYCGGTKDGGGRKLVYLPGSNRPKYQGKVYEMAREWDIDKLLDSYSNDFLETCLEACGLSQVGKPGNQAADNPEIDAFLSEHDVVVDDCNYGKAAIYGDPMLGSPGLLAERPVFGDHNDGLHAWIVRTTTRATELVKSGCLDARVFDDIDMQARALAKQHHEPHRYREREVRDCLAWAIANTGTDSGCRKHDPSAKRLSSAMTTMATLTTAATATALAATPIAPPPCDDSLWKSRPVLEHIATAAHSRGVSKFALLATVLARFCCEIRPRITLPPTVGTRASLNLYVAAASPSGGGKSAVMGVADELFHWGAPKRSVGSGEGLAQAYGEYDKSQGKWVQTAEAMFMSVDEISGLTALMDRSGSTLMSYLLTGYTGGQISAAYSDKTKRFVLPDQGYRLGLVVGIQFAKADGLFSHQDAGVPQRFVWASLTDPTIPEPEKRPAWPGMLTLPHRAAGTGSPESMTLPAEVESKIQMEHHLRVTGQVESDGSDDHRNLTQLKISGLLALMEDRMAISVEDWELAEQVMAQSDYVQAKAREVMVGQATAQLVQRAVAQGKASSLAKQHEDEDTVQRVALTIARHVWTHHAGGEPCTKKCMKNSLVTATRPFYGAARDRAVELNMVALELRPHPTGKAEQVAYLKPGSITP